jgi:hypothetical protein
MFWYVSLGTEIGRTMKPTGSFSIGNATKNDVFDFPWIDWVAVVADLYPVRELIKIIQSFYFSMFRRIEFR